MFFSNMATDTTGGFSIEQWLRVVGYSQYLAALRARGYVDYERCVNLSEEDIRAVVGVKDSDDDVWRLMERVKDLSKLSEEDAVKLLSSQNMSLYLACHNGDSKLAQQLITNGANVNWRNPLVGEMTPMYVAALNGHVDLLNMLIDAGGDVNIANVDKQTPVWAAAFDGHVGALNVLIRAKADVNAADETKRTPVWVAAQNGHVEALSVLISAGADYNAADGNQDTPAHIAAYHGHVDILTTLHQHGARLNAKNKWGDTPLSDAVSRNHISVIEFFKEIGYRQESATESNAVDDTTTITHQPPQSGEEQHTPPPDSTVSEDTTPDLSVDDDTAHGALEREVGVSHADLMLAGSPGSGKTSVMHLTLNEPPPDVRNSTGVETPVRAIASGTIYANGTMMQKLETEEMLDMLCGGLRHAIEQDIRSKHDEHMHTKIRRPVSSTAAATPTQDSLEDSPHQDVAAPPKAENSAKQQVSSSEAPAATEEEKLKVFANLMKEVSSVKASPDFLSATLVSTTDSGGQPQFMDACSLLLRSNSLFMITVKLNERLDAKPKFDFFINGKPISMCSTSLQLTNLQLIESIAKTVSSIQLSTVNTAEDGSQPRQAKFMLVGTFADKADECEGETIADKNRILKERLKHFKAELIDNGGDVIFPVNAVTTDPEERQKAALRLQKMITNTPGTSVKADIKLRWFGLLMHMLDVAKKKDVSILRLEEIIAAGKCLMMSEEETREAVKCFHDMNLVNHHLTEKLEQLVFVDSKPIVDQLTNLLGVAFIDKHMLDEIFETQVPINAQETLRDYGQFSQSLLESCFSFSAPLTAEVFLNILEHLSMTARIEKDGQTSFFLPCALPYAPGDVLCEKEKVSVTPWILRLKMRRGTIMVDAPIPKGYLPTLVVRLITSEMFEADTNIRQYRDLMSISYVDGGHVYFIERSHQLEIYYSWNEDLPEVCSIIRSAILATLVEAEEKLRFKPDILTKEDVFVCSCNGPQPRHFCTYKPRAKRANCERSRKASHLSQQQQYWLQPPPVDRVGVSSPPTAATGSTHSRATPGSPVTSSVSSTTTTPLTASQHNKDVTADNVLYMLMKYEFNPASWEKLAMGLRLGSTADQIEKDYKGSDAQLSGLINRWVATDINKSWEKLVEAMEMSDHRIAADNLARDKEVGVRPAKQ